jgi:two-component system, cell cycle sensor histidine kinase and response regulator CckA
LWKRGTVGIIRGGEMIESNGPPRGPFRKVIGVLRRAPAVHHDDTVDAQAHGHAMEAVARLAGGVAHELNNILLVVQGYVDMALQEDDAGPETRRHLLEVREAAGRATRLVGDLLVVGERGPFTPRLLDLNALLTRLCPVWNAEMGDRVHLSLADRLPPILADEQQIVRLGALFCARAREVMPSGGTLRFSTSLIDGDSSTPRSVALAVSDTGPTESLEGRMRLFEPYLPGPAGGKGQGLGLSLVHGIVKRIGGEITVYYPDDGGTTFFITIPAREIPRGAPPPEPLPHPSEASQARDPEEKRVAAGGTILLAEDDEGLRTLAARVLAREGYDVLSARDGQEAVELFERNKEHVSLALLDDVMPRMGGRAALLRMRTLVPGLPAILCTGYTWSLDGKAQETGEGFEVLPKPWRPRELLRLVREKIEQRQGR